MNQITVGLSTGGPRFGRAVRWAAELASLHGHRLLLVHVVDDEAVPGAGELASAAEEQARRRLQEAADASTSVDADLDIVTHLEHGSSVEVLYRLSNESDLLVIGSDKGGGRRPSRRSQNSLRIAAASAAPVAVIPEVDVSERRGIAVGVDGSEASDKAVVFAADEADRLGEPLIAVNSWDIVTLTGGEYGYAVPLVATDDLARYGHELVDEAMAGVAAKHPSVVIEKEVVPGDPVLALVETAGRAKMVVVGSRGRGAIVRLLLGSVSHGVLVYLKGPTVVIR